MDGVDAVLVAVGPKGDKCLQHYHLAYPKQLRKELLQLLRDPQGKLGALGDLDNRLGEIFARAANRCIARAISKGVARRTQILLIGSHGQTVYHEPKRRVSVQLASPAVISQRTGLTVVSDFRRADLIAGGEGAPFLPYYHRRLFAKNAVGRAVHNLGGISNFTYSGPKGKIVALDTGPASCLMDLAMHKLSRGRFAMDRNGAWARKGVCDEALLQWLKNIPGVKKYRSLAAPKSTGRELFSEQLLDRFLKRACTKRCSKENQMATLTQFSVDLAVEAYVRFVVKKGLPLKEIVFTGGGTYNLAMRDAFADKLPGVQLNSIETLGGNPQALEAQAFGVYALMAIAGKPCNIPAATGARQEVTCGQITPGANYAQLYQKVHSTNGQRL